MTVPATTMATRTLQHQIDYSEASLLGSYAEAVRHLHAVGAPLRPATAAE